MFAGTAPGGAGLSGASIPLGNIGAIQIVQITPISRRSDHAPNTQELSIWEARWQFAFAIHDAWTVVYSRHFVCGWFGAALDGEANLHLACLSNPPFHQLSACSCAATRRAPLPAAV